MDTECPQEKTPKQQHMAQPLLLHRLLLLPPLLVAIYPLAWSAACRLMQHNSNNYSQTYSSRRRGRRRTLLDGRRSGLRGSAVELPADGVTGADSSAGTSGCDRDLLEDAATSPGDVGVLGA